MIHSTRRSARTTQVCASQGVVWCGVVWWRKCEDTYSSVCEREARTQVTSHMCIVNAQRNMFAVHLAQNGKISLCPHVDDLMCILADFDGLDNPIIWADNDSECSGSGFDLLEGIVCGHYDFRVLARIARTDLMCNRRATTTKPDDVCTLVRRAHWRRSKVLERESYACLFVCSVCL